MMWIFFLYFAFEKWMYVLTWRQRGKTLEKVPDFFVVVFSFPLFLFLSLFFFHSFFFSFDEILFSVHQKRILSNIGAGIVKELPDKSRADCFMNPFSPRYL